MGEDHALWQHPRQRKKTQFRLKLELVTAATRRFDDCMHELFVVVSERCKTGWIACPLLLGFRHLITLSDSALLRYSRQNRLPAGNPVPAIAADMVSVR